VSFVRKYEVTSYELRVTRVGLEGFIQISDNKFHKQMKFIDLRAYGFFCFRNDNKFINSGYTPNSELVTCNLYNV
jgi:hypothetical protein